jgi:hypothetical protein
MPGFGQKAIQAVAVQTADVRVNDDDIAFAQVHREPRNEIILKADLIVAKKGMHQEVLRHS